MLTIERLREVLGYDAATGLFTRKTKRMGRGLPGSVAGSSAKRGYWEIRIDYKIYKAHRLAWFYVNGEWPAGDLDHINGDKADNRLSNLREATRSQNNANVGKPRHNTSGMKGVTWNKRKNKWMVRVGRDRFVGYFVCPAEASLAYPLAASETFGEFARAG